MVQRSGYDSVQVGTNPRMKKKGRKKLIGKESWTRLIKTSFIEYYHSRASHSSTLHARLSKAVCRSPVIRDNAPSQCLHEEELGIPKKCHVELGQQCEKHPWLSTTSPSKYECILPPSTMIARIKMIPQ